MTAPSATRRPRLQFALAAILLAGVYALAVGVRLRHVDEVTLGSDALGQFLGAWTVLNGGTPVPPNPEGGHSLWVLGLPCVLGGASLADVFSLRFALGALVAPLGAFAAFRLSPSRTLAWLAGALAGLTLAWDPGLVDTLVASFRGYGAPELVALSVAGAALAKATHRSARWTGMALLGAAFVGATGQHPMSAGVGLGLAVLLLAGNDRKHVVLGLCVAGLATLPRLHWLWQLGSCGAGFLECLGTVATGSAEPDVGRWTMLQRAFWDRGVVELGWGASLSVATGLVAAASHRDSRWLALAGLLAVVGVLGLGLTIQGLRPYHLRAAMPVLVVAAAVGFSVRPWALAVAAACVVFGGARLEAPRGPVGDLALVDSLGRALAETSGSVRVEAVWFGDPVGVEPAGVVLAARQAGMSATQLTVDEAAPVVLVVNLPDSGALPADLPPLHPRLDPIALGAAASTRVAQFSDLAAARAWIQRATTPPVVTGGSFDWVKAMAPEVGGYPSL